MKILAFYDGSGPKYHRILTPCYGLQKHGAECKIVTRIEENDLDGVDIVLFNRIVPGADQERLLMWREKYGFKLVCDLDDHWILDKGHPLYEGYQAHKVTERIVWFIKNSDVITVTHERLRDEVLPLNKNCYILPNSIPKVAQFTVKKVPDECVRLFWAGGVTHKRDLELLRRPLKLIKRDGVKFVMGGYVPKEPEWKEMAKIFTTDSGYNTMVIESLPPSEYYNTYALCDISLIPLLENKFNIYKSNLKILEAANIMAPCVVSAVHPYLDFPPDIVNYVGLHNTWYGQITKLINDKGLREEQGERLREYCDEHYNFEKITIERKQIFDATIKQAETRTIQAQVKGVA